MVQCQTIGKQPAGIGVNPILRAAVLCVDFFFGFLGFIGILGLSRFALGFSLVLIRRFLSVLLWGAPGGDVYKRQSTTWASVQRNAICFRFMLEP